MTNNSCCTLPKNVFLILLHFITISFFSVFFIFFAFFCLFFYLPSSRPSSIALFAFFCLILCFRTALFAFIASSSAFNSSPLNSSTVVLYFSIYKVLLSAWAFQKRSQGCIQPQEIRQLLRWERNEDKLYNRKSCKRCRLAHWCVHTTNAIHSCLCCSCSPSHFSSSSSSSTLSLIHKDTY